MISSVRLLLSLLVPLAACSERPPEATIARDGGIVRYSGMITPESATWLIPLLRGADKLVIYSQGGNVDAGIQIGNAIVDNGTAVEVQTLCSSSCAHYIFAVATEKIVPDRAAVLFHTSPFTWDRLARDGRITDQRMINDNDARLDRVVALYNRANVSVDVLICASEVIGVREETIRPSPLGGLRANTRFAGVYFSDEMLREYGFVNLAQAHDLSDGGRLAFKLEGTFIKVVRPGDC